MKLSSLDKSIKVIEILSENPRGLSLSELAEKLAFSASTVHHILSTFLPYDYVAQDQETKRYSLGLGLIKISKSVLENNDIRIVAGSFLLALSERCDETVHLYVLRNGMLTVLDMVRKKIGVSLSSYVGWTTDPHPAAAGKLLLSGLSNEQVIEIYKNRPLKRYSKNTITNMAQLLEELENVRRLGYAIDNEEFYEGIRCIAAPIRSGGTGKMLAALSITGSIFTLTMDRINREIIELVKDSAEKISSRIQ
jgi:DNA-binding IclR family transcriptional regulator